MTTLDQAIQGTVTKKTTSIREIQKFADFFKDGQGNRYTLQMTGETDDNGNDEYALYRDHHFKPQGINVYDNTMLEVVHDYGKNTCFIVYDALHLYPYIEKPVML